MRTLNVLAAGAALAAMIAFDLPAFANGPMVNRGNPGMTNAPPMPRGGHGPYDGGGSWGGGRHPPGGGWVGGRPPPPGGGWGGDPAAAFGAGVVGGIVGGMMSGAAQAPPPADIDRCAAYAAIIREDRLAHVRNSLLQEDLARWRACLDRGG